MRHLPFLSAAMIGLGLFAFSVPASAITNTSPAGLRAGTQGLDPVEPVHCRRAVHKHRHGHAWSRGCPTAVIIHERSSPTVVIKHRSRPSVAVHERSRSRTGTSTTIRSDSTVRSRTGTSTTIQSGSQPSGSTSTSTSTTTRSGSQPSTTTGASGGASKGGAEVKGGTETKGSADTKGGASAPATKQ
jgi:hypothetical protein